MALLLILIALGMSTFSVSGEVALANVTRFSGADFFTLVGSDCGPTRCMEVSHGTALTAMGGSNSCVCQCRADTPAFREDQHVCVNRIDECIMATFGRGTTQPQIPFVFLPLKGQIIYPSKEIVFTDVVDAVCAVTSAQYLSPSGWVTLRDVVDNDVPFGLYRDEGSTFLQWRGSSSLHARLEGRLVAVHVLCSAPTPTRLAASCAAFRVAGASHNSMLDVRSIPFHAGETVTTEPATASSGLSVLESLAICVCVLMLIFVYAAGIIFYVHYKKKHNRKNKDPEHNLSNTMSTDNTSTLDSRVEMDLRMKSNPLLKLDVLGSDFLHDAGLSDVSEHTEDTVDSSSTNTQTFQKTNSNVVSAMVHHTRRKKPSRTNIRATSTPERINERLQRRSASPDAFERAPHSDLSIVCSIESNAVMRQAQQPQSTEEPTVRRKLYFNPVFFEPEHLKNPPPAAIDFLIKIREVMSIAKEKMTSKRFIPILSDIPEEELYHTIDLGWDIPCARRGRRFSAISLKRENSRRAVHCGGCPGCESSEREQKAVALARSNSCKTCVSDDYKQKIVQKWLDEVPSPPSVPRPVKSVAKVSGTPRVIEPKVKTIDTHPLEPLRDEETKTLEIDSIVIKDSNNIEIVENVSEGNLRSNKAVTQKLASINVANVLPSERKSPSNHATRKVRRKLPPPPPPPVSPPSSPAEEVQPIPPEVKVKMEAVIRELHECTRNETNEVKELKIEKVIPKIVIPVTAADSVYYSDDNMLADKKKRDNYQKREFVDFDSLERTNMLKKRRFSLACGPEFASQKEENRSFPNLQTGRDRLSQSWRDVRKAIEGYQIPVETNSDVSLSNYGNRSIAVSEVFINTIEPLYNNISKPGPLTIEVRGSPVANRRNFREEFDPDTLDRKPKKETKKRVDKILLKSGGSFKFKSPTTENVDRNSPKEEVFTRKIGSLRQIFEAKTKAQEEDINMGFSFYERRGSIPNTEHMINLLKTSKTPDLIRQIEPKPPIPPKQCHRESPPGDRRLLEERERVMSYSKTDNLNARRSGRRSARTRSRRTDLRKLYRTEDSGYLSTDSNESKRRARYLMQLRPKTIVPEPISLPTMTNLARAPPIQVESDTDDLESFCDGRSESGGESVETDSVFFGNFNDSKQIFAELGYGDFDNNKDQIDSGFAGETNIILSGDSDSEHKSVISIIAGCDGRASAASISNLDETPYVHQVEC